MPNSPTSVFPVVLDLQMPAGILGPDPVTADVRCFLVPHESGVLLVDTGTPGSAAALTAGLAHIGAGWREVTDVVLTHAHFDHTAGLFRVLALAPAARVWAGAEDIPAVDAGERPVVALKDGDHLRSFTVLATPGHTPGHLSLLDEAASLLLVGDLVGALDGTLSRAPAVFTADAAAADESLRRVAELDVSRVLFSHGEELADGPAALKRLVEHT
jgi:glyoxylase-like metal-dependent hydrolase (beta-lactamase superfamily II)